MLWSVETMPSSPEALLSAMTSAGVSRPSEWTVCTWGAMRYQPGLSFNCGAAYDGAGSFFCPRTFRKGDFQRPVGGAPCRRGHLDDGPPARIDPPGEIAGRGFRFADFETAACAARPAAESRTFESRSPLVEDAEVQIARTRFARTEMLGYADLYDAFGYGERGVDRNIVLFGSSLAREGEFMNFGCFACAECGRVRRQQARYCQQER